MDNQEQKPGPSTTTAPGTPTGAAAAQLQLLQLQQQLHQHQQQQQQSAFARFQPTAKTLPGYGIVRELPPSVPTSAAAVLSPFTFQPYTDGRFPKPEPLTSYVPGFDMAPQQQLLQKPAVPPPLLQQPQQPTAAASNITPETLNVLYAFLNQMQQQPTAQPVQQLQQHSHPHPSALGKLLAETRGGDDSGTESMSSPGSPGSRSRSNSFSVSCLMAQAAAARRNSDILAAVAAANALTPASSRGSLASGSSGSVEALPRAGTPPSGAQTTSAATTPRVAAAASEARYAPYTPPTPTAAQQPAAAVPNPYGAAAASQQQHQLQQLHLQQQAQQQLAMHAAMQAWNNPLGYHPAFPMLMREDCVVCEDRASGYHYGVLSCEGCKGFFRRSISKNETYECMRMRNCPIKKESRNRCQACRLAKCIARGMSKDCVRADRRKNKRKVEAEERRETNQKTVAQFAQYQLIIEQCSIAYSDAFPDGTYIMSREEALARTEKFVSAVPLLAAGGRDAAERALERVVIVRAAYTTDTCIALHPPADAVMCLQQVFSVAAGAAPLVRHPLSNRLVAVATALEIAGAADIRADRAIETLQFSLQFQLATEHASPLYNAMARILGRGPALAPDVKPEPKPESVQ